MGKVKKMEEIMFVVKVLKDLQYEKDFAQSK